MPKRTVIAGVVALFLTLGYTSLDFAESKEKSAKRDGKIVRVIKAPFKALGKIFSRPKNSDKREGPEIHTAARHSHDFPPVAPNILENVVPPPLEINDLETPPKQQEQLAPPPPATGPVSGDHLAEGRKLLESGRYDEAIVELSMASVLGPNLIEANNLLGIAYDRKGLHDRAREVHRRVLSAQSDNAEALGNLGYSLYMSGDDQNAALYLKRAASLNPNSQQVLYRLALAQYRLGKYEDAFRSFQRSGNEFAAHLSLATRSERAGKYREAIKHYEAARVLKPSSATILQHLAALYQKAGYGDDAAATVRAFTVRGS